MRLALFPAVALVLASCSDSSFQAGAAPRRLPEKKPVPTESATTSAGDAAGSSTTPTPPASGDVFGGDGTASLPTDCNDQSVLILDFKSGWWEGDGGDTFRNLILNEIQMHACPGSNAGIEYHHIIQPAPARFYDKDFKAYTQVWILSGSLADDVDIRLNEPGFLDVLQQIALTKPKLFLGAGFGSVDHANEVAKKVWNADLFATDAKSGAILSVFPDGSNVTVKTRVTPKVSGNLFQGVAGSIVDHVQVSEMYAGSVELIAGRSGLSVLSDCTTPPVIYDPLGFPQNVASRTVPCVGVAKNNGFKVVADSGIQRFYGLYRGEEATKIYLRNILRALSL